MLQLGAPAAEARAEKFIVGRAQVAGRTRESEDLLSVRHGSSSFGRDAANASMRREKLQNACHAKTPRKYSGYEPRKKFWRAFTSVSRRGVRAESGGHTITRREREP